MPVPVNAEKLKKLRIQSGMSQSQLASKAGLSVPTIQKYENGKEHKPGLETVLAIAEALSCRLEEFLDIPNSETQSLLADLVSSLSPDEQIINKLQEIRNLLLRQKGEYLRQTEQDQKIIQILWSVLQSLVSRQTLSVAQSKRFAEPLPLADYQQAISFLVCSQLSTESINKLNEILGLTPIIVAQETGIEIVSRSDSAISPSEELQLFYFYLSEILREERLPKEWNRHILPVMPKA